VAVSFFFLTTAYFLEVQSRRGVPDVATFNLACAPNVGGGQWAAYEERPDRFEHGEFAHGVSADEITPPRAGVGSAGGR
jgi:hypothetical protein